VDRTLIATVADRPGVLNRVASLFRRRAFNIESLTVGHTERAGVSRMTIVVDGRRTDAGQVARNLRKLVDVLDVEDISDRPSVLCDLALIKVRIGDLESRREVLQIAEGFQARLVDMCPRTAMVEISGDERKVDTAVEAFRTHGILEMVRTGRVAMVRGDSSADAPTTAGAASKETDDADEGGS